MQGLSENPLSQMVDKLAEHAELLDDDRIAVLNLPYLTREIGPGGYFIREGAITDKSDMLLSGLAVCQKISGNGDRQILSVKIPGDILCLQSLYFDTPNYNVQALTRCNVVTVSSKLLKDLATQRSSIKHAIFISTLIETSMLREWLLNVGRRDAQTRTAHFLCEFAVRIGKLDQIGAHSFELLMTREQLGDALGLTAVHINRTLKALAKDGLIEREGKNIRFPHWGRLCDVADFSTRYLHLDQ